jgi:pre-rRNA-processing protein TSR1
MSFSLSVHSPSFSELFIFLSFFVPPPSFVIQHGFRSYWTKPIFSESNLNCDKHKFQRYLPSDGFSVASCIGPVTMTPLCPLLVFKESSVDGSLVLVATGSLLNIDPDRIMLKKVCEVTLLLRRTLFPFSYFLLQIILTGNPVRVRKRIAVVKHMFYDPLVRDYLVVLFAALRFFLSFFLP